MGELSGKRARPIAAILAALAGGVSGSPDRLGDLGAAYRARQRLTDYIEIETRALLQEDVANATAIAAVLGITPQAVRERRTRPYKPVAVEQVKRP